MVDEVSSGSAKCLEDSATTVECLLDPASEVECSMCLKGVFNRNPVTPSVTLCFLGSLLASSCQSCEADLDDNRDPWFKLGIELCRVRLLGSP